MIDHILVCPFDEMLISRFKQCALVISTDDFNILNYIEKKVNHGNKLHAIWIKYSGRLSDIQFEDSWNNIPLAIYARDFGDFKEFLKKLHIIRRLNIRFFLSTTNTFNYTAMKIMSSLHIGCGLYFEDNSNNWELINDLGHYTLYNQLSHTPIEPFYHLAKKYSSEEYIDFSQVYFEYPAKYLHINENLQIALSKQELDKGEFIDEGMQALKTIKTNKLYQDRLASRYNIMLQKNECSFCGSFRICLGRFQQIENKVDTCKKLFEDLFDAVEYYSSTKQKERQLWQL